MSEGAKVRIIDASTAHRVAPGWTYGFPEIVGREAVANASRIANPGCYPTGFIALVAPLVRICSAVTTWTGSAPSLAMRLMLEPVISTRSSCCCWPTACMEAKVRHASAAALTA